MIRASIYTISPLAQMISTNMFFLNNGFPMHGHPTAGFKVHTQGLQVTMVDRTPRQPVAFLGS